MSSSAINIVPVTNTITNTITNIVIFNIQCQLFNNASCQVSCFDASHNLISTTTQSLTTDQYNNWLGDDSYFVNTILSNMGFTRSS